ncbi:MAG: prepilin-type N-terminal cleavage/methylation domain-containing protein [Candidatus Muiribacteriota bacterium]
MKNFKGFTLVEVLVVVVIVAILVTFAVSETSGSRRRAEETSSKVNENRTEGIINNIKLVIDEYLMDSKNTRHQDDRFSFDNLNDPELAEEFDINHLLHYDYIEDERDIRSAWGDLFEIKRVDDGDITNFYLIYKIYKTRDRQNYIEREVFIGAHRND